MEASVPLRAPLTRRVRAILGWTWYPTLIAVVYIINPYSTWDISAWAVGRVLAVAVILAISLTLIGRALLGRDRGSAVAGLGVMSLAVADSPGRLVLVGAAIALIGFEARLWARGAMRLRIPWARVTAVLNLVLTIFLAIQVGTIVIRRYDAPTPAVAAEWQATPSANAPDIFLILADGHGRSDVLQRDYDYDMTPLEDELSELGFDEASNSHANHVLTRFSLAVLLNGHPFAELGQDMAAPVDERLVYAVTESSSAANLLRSAGYETVVVSSGFDHLGLRSVDRYVDVGPRNEYEEAIIRSTAAGQLFDAVTGGLVTAVRDRVFDEFSVLEGLAAETSSRPRFVLMHLPTPHWPVAFQADCTLRPNDGYSLGAVARDNHRGDAVSAKLVADQTACVDALLGAAMANLVRARPNSVAIVFSDHGPEELLDWWDPDEPGLSDRFANMFFARTPGHPGLFPDDITLVNVLPSVFNAYLGTDLPLHANDLFFGPTENLDHFVPYAPQSP